MKSQKVYKVVKIIDGEYRSTLHTHHGEFSLTYIPNERTTARRGTIGVLVFGDLGHAKKFAITEAGTLFNERGYRILECEGFGLPIPVYTLAWQTQHYLFAHFRRLQIIGRFHDFIFRRSGGRYRGMLAPSGTYSVESVIPRKVVA